MKRETNIRTLLTFFFCLIAATGIMSGCSDEPPDLPADPSPETVHALLTDPGGNQFLKEISLHPWGQDSTRATELFSWIPDDATSSDTRRSAMAGQTALALAKFLANNSNELRGSPDSDTDKAPIGTANPDLTATYAAALVPYFGAMVGDPRGTSDFGPLDSVSGEMPRTVAVLAALRTGDAASDRVSTGLADLVDDYESTFAQYAVADPASVLTQNDLLTRAARLLGAARASGFDSVGEYALDPGDVTAQLQYRLASQLITTPNRDISSQFFDSRGLLSPNEVRDRLGESSWDEYTNQLRIFLANTPRLTDAVNHFRTSFLATSQ